MYFTVAQSDQDGRKHAKREPVEDALRAGAVHHSNFSPRLHKSSHSVHSGLSSHRVPNYRQERDLVNIGAGYQPTEWHRSHVTDSAGALQANSGGSSLKLELSGSAGGVGGICSQQLTMASSTGCVTSSDDEDQPHSATAVQNTNTSGLSPFNCNQYGGNQYMSGAANGAAMPFGDQPTYYPTHTPCAASSMPASGYFAPYDPVMAGLRRLHGTASGHVMSMGGACGGNYAGGVGNPSGGGPYYAGLMHAGIGRNGSTAACRYSPTPTHYPTAAGHVAYPAGNTSTSCLEPSSPQSRDHFTSATI